jgi:hypothetical protein
MTMIIDGTNGVTFPSTTVQGDAGVGYGQTWQNVTASRAVNTTYTNTTTKPIMVVVSTSAGSPTTTLSLTVSGITLIGYQSSSVTGGTFVAQATAIVPAGATYSMVAGGMAQWRELS